VNQVKDILNQNWLGTLIGVLAGLVIAYRFKSRARLAAQVNTLELAGPNAVLPNDIAFMFRGHKVPNVTMSRIAIWNIGNTTLKGDQIVTSDPLRIITSEGSTILEATVRNRTRQVNEFTCALRGGKANEVECRFDYLDPGDGALMQLIHTGDDKVAVVGTLRGIAKSILVAGKARRQVPQNDTSLSAGAAKLLAVGFTVAGTVLLGLVWTDSISYGWSPPSSLPEIAGIVFTVTGLLLLFTIRYIPPNRIGTQMTSNEPSKAFWRNGIGALLRKK
jgi:hypothetical protein